MRPDSTPEGTIRFRYTLRPAAAADVIAQAHFAVLEGWRRVLLRAGLVGRDRARYDGFAFGNLSMRDPTDTSRFFVTASQTVDAEALAPSDIVRIDACDLADFSALATGVRPPSSETLTHAAVYRAAPGARWLFHVHSREIWRSAGALALPATGRDTPYGSAALADEVAALLDGRRGEAFVFVTPGHEDGVFACGQSADEVGCALLRLLAAAFALAARDGREMKAAT
jgi:hypothetical protein